MRKSLLTVFVVLAAAIAIDLLFEAANRAAARSLNFALSGTLFGVRPLVLAALYVPALIAGYSLIEQPRPGNALSLLLIAIGLAVVYLTTLPPGSGFDATRAVYTSLVAISVSRLGLTVHVGAFLVAVGIVRFLPWPLRSKT